MSIKEKEPRYWQHLAERNADGLPTAATDNEFQTELEPQEMDGQTRRHFMGVMGASAAMASMAGCIRRPVEHIMPYSKMPEDVLPGVASHYATATHIGGDVIGMVVESNDGRPTKIEGNQEHPSSNGGTTGIHQAMVLDLYDPMRAMVPKNKTKPTTWEAAEKFLKSHFSKHSGRGLHVLSQANPSWTFRSLASRVVEDRYKGSKWYTYESLSHDNEREGLSVAFKGAKGAADGANRAVYNLEVARAVLALDSDFLGSDARSVANADAWATLRDPDAHRGRMSRLYSVEPVLSLTGSNADHRMRLRHEDIEAFAFQIAIELAKDGKRVSPKLFAVAQKRAANLSPEAKKFAAVVAQDLAAAEPKVTPRAINGVVIAGPRQSALVHNLVASINQALGGTAETVNYYRDESRGPRSAGDAGDAGNLVALSKALRAGEVETLVILGNNPVYTAPGDLKFAEALKKAKTIICLTDYDNETTAHATWTIPRSHFLEAWGDLVDIQGFAAFQQPLIEPLFGSWSDIEFLARMLTDEPNVDGYSQVRKVWKSAMNAQRQNARPAKTPYNDAEFDKAWRRWLHAGRIGDNRQPMVATMVSGTHRGPGNLLDGGKKSTKASATSLDVIFVPGYNVYDGRFANNSWLQECPDPITKLAWDNAVLMSPKTADALKVPESSPIGKTQTTRVTLEVNGRSVDMPAWIVPGMADNTLAVAMGYGRDFKGYLPYHDNDVVGFDVNVLRTMASPYVATGASVKKGGMYPIACLQRFGEQNPGFGYDTRPLVRETSLDNYRKDPTFAQDGDIIHCYEGMKPVPDECDDGKGGTVRGGVLQKKTVDGKPADYIVSYPGGGGSKSRQLNAGPSKGANYSTPAEYAKMVAADPSKADVTYSKYQWGLNIDLNRCTGCNACVVACVAENNIPSVGKEEARYGREMHWIRMDRYFVDKKDTLEVVHQPMLCQQCETAPCENVCPVQATSHSPEGLNDMAYNRCIGTRYCANNCPFKVRRFNFYNYTSASSSWNGFKSRDDKVVDPKQDDELFQMVRNPDVSVRFRGVMEKCTYCIQRINRGKRQAKLKGDERIIDSISPACAQVCSSKAITFGNINSEKKTLFLERRNRDRQYQMLTELNLRPRTTYLGKVRNTNTKLGAKKDG